MTREMVDDDASPESVRPVLSTGGTADDAQSTAALDLDDIQIPRIAEARRYLSLLGGGDVPHSFQAWFEPDPNNPATSWMRRHVYGRLDDIWPELMDRQSKGAAIGVRVAETDGRGRKWPNMVRPRAVWIEADDALPRTLPLLPTVTVETSPGRHHYIYVVRDLSWQLWHGVQRLLVDQFGSDSRAAQRTQVLRLPGTLHRKNPDRPFVVSIVEELTSEHVYTAAEISAAFPPIPAASSNRAGRRIRHRRHVQTTPPAPEWDPQGALSAFLAIDKHIQLVGPFTACGNRPDDQEIVVDWSQRPWWLRAIACIHDASGGSDEGFDLSCIVSRGDVSKGVVGCLAKFNIVDQRRVWVSLTSGQHRELDGMAVTMRTIYWIARRYTGWKSGRRGRPPSQPRPGPEISSHAQAVAEAGRWTVSHGLEHVRDLHKALSDKVVPAHTLKGRILSEIRAGLDPKTGVAAIGSQAGMAATVGCGTETLRKYLRELASLGLIVKNEGNATSMLGRAGTTIALSIPEEVRRHLEAPQARPHGGPPISDQTGVTTPPFGDLPGWNPSRFPTSHAREAALGVLPPNGEGDDLWGKPDLSLGDWFQAGVLHAEVGDHLERLADAHGKKAVSRVLARLKELRSLRPSFLEIRADAERAADLAARSLVRTKFKELPELELRRLLDQASPATVPDEESATFVRKVAYHLDAIIRQAKGDPDPWRSKRWQRPKQAPEVARSEVNAYAAARFKREVSH